MRSFATATVSTWLASSILLQPIGAIPNAAPASNDSCASVIERDVIVVGGGSGGT
jgi:hypothetical protein